MVYLSVTGGTLAIHPVSGWSHGARYTVTVPVHAVTDTVDNDLPQDFSFCFTTLAPPDSIPPVTGINLNGIAGRNNWYISDVQATLTAVDNEGGSGVAGTVYSFDGTSWHACTGPLTLSAEGETTLYYRSADKAGNQAAKTSTYHIRYVYSGVLKPINQDGSSEFKLGGAIPVKFQLADAGGSFITGATARLYLAKIENGAPGREIEAVSAGSANTGNLFRYDAADNQYIFNLKTRELSTGAWRLRIAPGDGASRYADITLR